MQLAFLGLGKMGQRMAAKLAVYGYSVVVWNRTWETTRDFATNHKKNIISAQTVGEAIKKLSNSPKIIWLMLPAGGPTDEMLREILPLIEARDIVIDGGNANFHDSERRSKECEKRGILFLGIGVSGGIVAATEGYPMMVGGDKAAYEIIRPILDTLAVPHGGHHYFGSGGSGHFVKMVHNGIEYGMMQAIAEGFAVMEKSNYDLDLTAVGKLWQKGTIVSSFLIDRAVEMLAKDPTLSEFAGIVTESGEGRWTVEEAKKENIDVPIIEGSLTYRWNTQDSEEKQQSYVSRMLNALRNAFGGHEVKK